MMIKILAAYGLFSVACAFVCIAICRINGVVENCDE
jgi:hypothetical protein